MCLIIDHLEQPSQISDANIDSKRGPSFQTPPIWSTPILDSSTFCKTWVVPGPICKWASFDTTETSDTGVIARQCSDASGVITTPPHFGDDGGVFIKTATTTLCSTVSGSFCPVPMWDSQAPVSGGLCPKCPLKLHQELAIPREKCRSVMPVGAVSIFCNDELLVDARVLECINRLEVEGLLLGGERGVGLPNELAARAVELAGWGRKCRMQD